MQLGSCQNLPPPRATLKIIYIRAARGGIQASRYLRAQVVIMRSQDGEPPSYLHGFAPFSEDPGNLDYNSWSQL